MFYLRHLLTAALAAAFLPAALAADPALSAEQQFERLRQQREAPDWHLPERSIELAVDLSGSPGLSVETRGEQVEVRYRMAFNQIAEGWSWQPQADPAVEDYYRFKFLPLQSVNVERGEYEHEDKIGVPQQMKVSWRYDYFLAFENLYDFYPRAADDDAGFVAQLAASQVAHLGMRARAHLVEPVLSESTTFWKATYGKPTDFTLKKRYLVGVLDEVDFVDTEDGRILCRIRPGQTGCRAD